MEDQRRRIDFQQRLDAREEGACDPLQRGEPDLLALGERNVPLACEIGADERVAGTGEPGDAGPLDHLDASVRAVEVGLPLSRLAEPEEIPGPGAIFASTHRRRPFGLSGSTASFGRSRGSVRICASNGRAGCVRHWAAAAAASRNGRVQPRTQAARRGFRSHRVSSSGYSVVMKLCNIR